MRRIEVVLTRASDGAARTYVAEAEGYSMEDDEFAWSEGNYHCDCNRHLFWLRAGGDGPGHIECGEGMYRVRVVSDGRVLLDEPTSADPAKTYTPAQRVRAVAEERVAAQATCADRVVPRGHVRRDRA